MILQTEQDIKNHIKQNNPSNLYLIYGEEDYLKNHYFTLLSQSITDTSLTSFNYLVFNSEMTFDMFYEACETLPVMSDRICITVKDFPLHKLKEDEFEQFERYFNNIPSTTTVIFYMATIQTDSTAKWKKIIDIFNKNGICFELQKRTTNSIAKLLVASAEKRNAKITIENATYLINCVGDELTVLLNEFDKVCSFANGREITPEIIDKVAIKSLEANIFDLTKAINTGNSDKAYEILSVLFKQKTEPTLILGVIASEYIDLYRMKKAQKYNGSLSEISQIFGYKNKEFRLKNAQKSAQKFSEKRIDKMIEVIADADIKLKSFNLSPTLVIEELTAKLLLLTSK